jgi:ATP synthase subunit 6
LILKLNTFLLVLLIACFSISTAEEKHGDNHTDHTNKSYGYSSKKTENLNNQLDESHQKIHSDNHSQNGQHNSDGGEHHSSGVDGELIMHHIQDGETFEIFNPIDPFHPTEIHLTTTWSDLSPTLANWFSWIASGSGIEEDPEQLFITKQSIMMLIASLLLVLAFYFGYNRNKKVQSGLGNLLEVFVVFIKDEVVYPNMGEKQGRKFLPLILTFFFFIVTLNLLGLIPGSSTATASFSVTIGLALITFFTYILFGNKDFWKHIFATPGVPVWLLPIMIPVEIIGLFTKPFALSVRLLANMNAGHIIILAFLGIIINMKSYGAAFGAIPMAVAINMLEIFVAFLQGYIFSLLSSIFIGMAVVEHEHH